MNTIFLRIFTILNLLFLLAGVSSAQCTDTFLETRTVVLDQGSQVLGTVESAAVLSDGSFVVATEDPRVSLFDSGGSFTGQLGRPGRGPFEYQGSLTVRPAGKNIAIWDSGNRKLLLFSPDGTSIREWTGMGRAVSDFVVRRDTLYAYHSGGTNEDYVSIYEYDNQESPAVALGDAPGEHFPLNLLDGSGGLTFCRGHLLYASPAEPVVHKYNPKTNRRDSWRMDDPAFSTEAVVEYESLEDINADILRAGEQALRSSRFYFLQSIGVRVLSVLQHGELVYEKSLAEAKATGETESTLDVGGVETNTRRFHVHLHTQDGDALACESLSFSKNEIESDSPIVGTTPRGFLVFTTQTKDDTTEYKLTEYSVPRRTK